MEENSQISQTLLRTTLEEQVRDVAVWNDLNAGNPLQRGSITQSLREKVGSLESVDQLKLLEQELIAVNDQLVALLGTV